ncbi:hypothetical protein BKA62DRAFT_703430 [Auriculariales sp. MPI-PUGE-AT-0066]|nr:hypothetical protein BKA62DRAFT_703430 [Auriculariales sp. MPI-PUGE-AT-0066]
MRASVFFTVLASVALAASAPLTQHDLAAAKAAVDKCNTDLHTIEAKLLQAYNATRTQRGMLPLTVSDADFVNWVSTNSVFDGKKRQCAVDQAHVTIVQAALEHESGSNQSQNQSRTTATQATSATSSSTKIPVSPHVPATTGSAASSSETGTKPSTTISGSSTQSLPAGGQTTPVAGGGAAPTASESSPTKQRTTFPLTVPPMTSTPVTPASPTQPVTPGGSAARISHSSLFIGAALAVVFLMS